MAATEGDAADTAIAGLITTVQGLPWDKAKQQAQGFGDDLDMVSAKAGVAGQDVAQAFQAMTELKGATATGVASALENVSQISTVAGVLGKSAEGLSREFGFMAEGVVKTKGQLFQLLQTTGIFGKDTKKASEYWGKLTEESRIKALDYGLSRVSKSMAEATPSAKQLLTSIDSLYETGKERLGGALLDELVPVLQDVKQRMMSAIPSIEKMAKEIGPVVGQWVGRAVDKIEDGFRYLKDHTQEIHDTIVSAYEKAKSVIDYIIANRDAIALAFGAKTAIPAIGGAVTGAKAAYSSASAVAGLAGMGGTAGSLAVMGAFAAAVAVFAAGAYFLGKHIQESKAHTESQVAKISELSAIAEEGDVARIESLSQVFRNMSIAMDGELNPSLKIALEHIHSIAETSAKMKQADVSSIDREIAMAVEKMKDLPAVTAAQLAAGQSQKAAQGYADQVALSQAALLIDAYNQAAKSGNASTALMAATTIANSKLLEEAFLKSSMAVEGGLEKFADVVIGGGAQFASFGAAIRGKAGAKVPGAPSVVMTGGQVFKITQDFRDQDPDRIGMIFERDLVKLAENRVQARTTMPFGG